MKRLGSELRSHDIVDNCFGQFNLSRGNAFEHTPNCVGYSINVTVVYSVGCSEITRRIANVFAPSLIVCPFCITMICIALTTYSLFCNYFALTSAFGIKHYFNTVSPAWETYRFDRGPCFLCHCVVVSCVTMSVSLCPVSLS